MLNKFALFDILLRCGESGRLSSKCSEMVLTSLLSVMLTSPIQTGHSGK